MRGCQALHHLETWTRSYWGEEEAIEIASDDDTPRATAARASSPTTTADGGVDGRAERGVARTSRTSTTAAAVQREGPVLSPGGSEAAAQLGRASRRRRGFTSPSSLDLDDWSLGACRGVLAASRSYGNSGALQVHDKAPPQVPEKAPALCTVLVAGLVCSSLLVSRRRGGLSTPFFATSPRRAN